MINIIESPNSYDITEGRFAFVYDKGSNSIISDIFPSPFNCSSLATLVIGDTEQECLDYIQSNNITDGNAYNVE